MAILWRDSMKIGNPEVDAEHKHFIALMNLIERGLEQDDVSAAEEIFEELLVYVENHLPAEEAFLESIGFPNFEEHKKQLRRSRENVLKVLAGDQAGLTAKEVGQVNEMLATMTSRYGYCRECAKDAILFLLRKRYDA